jgi:hypothetical protein
MAPQPPQLADLPTPHARQGQPLGAATNVRFTAAQYELLRDLAARLDRKLSALVRDIVVVWAMNHPDRRGGINVSAMVADLQAAGEDES